VGARDEAYALALAADVGAKAEIPVFLPYLSGERTPHNDAAARGVLFGVSHDTGPGECVRAVLEGVAFALADGQDALAESGAPIGEVSVIGGGARSALWVEILAAALERPLSVASDAEVGPALGAARLARLAVGGEEAESVCAAAAVERTVEPRDSLREALAGRRRRFRELYPALRERFAS